MVLSSIAFGNSIEIIIILQDYKSYLIVSLSKTVYLFQDHIPEPVSARPVPKLRPKSGAVKAPIRPRPKTIHVDQGADVSASLASSRGTRGSSSNLSGNLVDSSSST